MKLFLIRHGQTTTNTKGLTHKHNDAITLNETGKEQAIRLIPVCQKNEVETLYTSSTPRALETGKIISDVLLVPLIINDELMERNWGDWAGKPWEDIRSELEKMSLQERYTFIPPNGESWEHMEERLHIFLHTISSLPQQSIAIITHEGTLRALIRLMKNEPKEESFHYHFDNASVSQFNNEKAIYTQVSLNDTTHLDE